MVQGELEQKEASAALTADMASSRRVLVSRVSRLVCWSPGRAGAAGTAEADAGGVPRHEGAVREAAERAGGARDREGT